MRSSNRSLLLVALLLGGCASGWWRDPPAATPALSAQQGTLAEPYQPAASAELPADDAPPAVRPVPARRQPDQSAYDAAPPPARAVRYDNVGYAVWSTEAGTVAAAHATLSPGSFVEVTALDTGKTVLVPITAVGTTGREIELSGAAAQELGLAYGGTGAVRVRASNPTGADLTALRAGRPAPARPDTPPVLLNALRRKLDGTLGQPGGARPSAAPAYQTPTGQRPPNGYVPSAPLRPQAPRPAARPPATVPATAAGAAPAAGPGYYVQVAAMADPTRAQAIARQLGGKVSSGAGLHRVRFGPFDDLRTAQAARDDVATRGYADARIVRQD